MIHSASRKRNVVWLRLGVLLPCLAGLLAVLGASPSSHQGMKLQFEWADVSMADIASGIVWELRKVGLDDDVVVEVHQQGEIMDDVPSMSINGSQPHSPTPKRFDVRVGAANSEQMAIQLANQIDGFSVDYDGEFHVLSIVHTEVATDNAWPLNLKRSVPVSLSADCGINLPSQYSHPGVAVEMPQSRKLLFEFLHGVPGESQLLIIQLGRTPGTVFATSISIEVPDETESTNRKVNHADQGGS